MSTGSVSTARTPLAILREAEAADEVLFLTYTANLEFFERWALRDARDLEAAVTVIADATMVTSDPSAVRHAGVRYLDARAVCPGGTAFHAKLMVIAGKTSASVAIGSGNLTLAGWHGNKELWTVLHADVERGPTAIRQVSGFLRALAGGSVRLSSDAPGVLERIAQLLDGMAADEPGPQVVAPLVGPIIEQVPRGPVDELVLYAPFFDTRLVALEALHARLQPNRTTIFVQSHTSVDGPLLEEWLSRRGGRLEWCADAPYRHGKLVEWSRDGVREALTGSPNISGPALLRRLDGHELPGANCELGIIARVTSSLAPAATTPPGAGAADLAIRPSGPDDRLVPSIVLLDARLAGAVIRLLLASPLAGSVTVQAYHEERGWTTVAGVADLAPGEQEHAIPATLPAGQPMRLLGPSGPSNVVFVTDSARARAQPVKRIGEDLGGPVDFLLDGKFDAWWAQIELLRPEMLKRGALLPKRADSETASADDESESVVPAAKQTLADYIAACGAVFDEPTITWALTLPALPGLGGDESFDRHVGVLTDETDDAAIDLFDNELEPESLAEMEALRQAVATRRRRFQRFATALVDHLAEFGNVGRAYAAKLVLLGVALDLWPDQFERDSTLEGMVHGLVTPGDEARPEERRALASYLAVALALLRESVRRLSVNDESTLRFNAAAAAARSALEDLDPVIVNTLVLELADAFGDGTTGDRVAAIATEIRNPSTGVAAALAMLSDEDGIEAGDENGVLVLYDALPVMPERELLRICGLTQSTSAVVRGQTERGIEVTCVWRAPSLLIAKGGRAGVGGNLYRLPDGITPATLAAGWEPWGGLNDNLPKPTVAWLPGKPPPPEAADLLDSALRVVEDQPSAPTDSDRTGSPGLS